MLELTTNSIVILFCYDTADLLQLFPVTKDLKQEVIFL